MVWYDPQAFEFNSGHEQILQKTEIGYESGPGTVLHDFAVILDYILADRPFRVTGAHQLPLKALSAINERLAHPINHGLKRPQQKSFPHIHGLYLLVRASGLTYVDETGSKPLLRIDETVHERWQGLNPTEQYGNLLESWLLRGNPEIIGERDASYGLIPRNFYDSLGLLADVDEDGLTIGDDMEMGSISHRPGWHNLGLLDLFGCITIKHGAVQAGKRWQIERIERTSFGRALFALLLDDFFRDVYSALPIDQEEKPTVGLLQPILKPYFPAWQNNLVFSKQASREGVHVFKVSLGRLWRRIALPDEASLHTLASTILTAVSFDHSHLYEFSIPNRFGIQKKFMHPYMDREPLATEISVGEAPLRVGQTITFLYDFGDDWEFDVTLERVDADMDIEEPMVLEAHGEPPEQYRSWDEEW
jgi:hypothetical protein